MNFDADGYYIPSRKEAYIQLDMPGKWVSIFNNIEPLTNHKYKIDYTNTRHAEMMFLRGLDNDPPAKIVKVGNKTCIRLLLERLNYSGIFEEIVDPSDRYINLLDESYYYTYDESTDMFNNRKKSLSELVETINSYYYTIHNFPLHNIEIYTKYLKYYVSELQKEDEPVIYKECYNNVCLVNRLNYSEYKPNWFKFTNDAKNILDNSSGVNVYKICGLMPLSKKSMTAIGTDLHRFNQLSLIMGLVGHTKSYNTHSLVKLKIDDAVYEFNSRNDVFDIADHLLYTISCGTIYNYYK